MLVEKDERYARNQLVQGHDVPVEKREALFPLSGCKTDSCSLIGISLSFIFFLAVGTAATAGRLRVTV